MGIRRIVGILETIGSTKVIANGMDVMRTARVSQTLVDVDADNFTVLCFDVSRGRLMHASHNITMMADELDREAAVFQRMAASVTFPLSAVRAVGCSGGQSTG